MNKCIHEESLFVSLLQLKVHIISTIDKPKHNGICDYVNITFKPDNPDNIFLFKRLYNQELNRLFSMWPEFSGNINFPVPVNYEFYGKSLRGAYSKTCYEGTLWDQSTEYGKARMRLLNWMIERLTFELGIY